MRKIANKHNHSGTSNSYITLKNKVTKQDITLYLINMKYN